MRGRLVLILLALAVLAVAPCRGGDTWEELMPGVRHLHRTTATPWDIHVVTIDLTSPRVDLRVAIKNDHDKSDGGETVRSMCQRYNAVAGVNCDFWGPSPVSHCPQGHCVTDGLTMLPTGYAAPINPNRTTLAIPADNSYGVINKVVTPGAWWWNVAAGGPRLIRNGTVGWESEPDIPDQTVRAPRTGAAISQDWRTLILATVDGRQASSAGMTGNEMGALLKEFGGYNGMAFDGGGSTTMVINGGTVNSPSDGSDRRVANCLMVLDRLRQGSNPLTHYETGFENLPCPLGPLSGIDGWIGSGEIVIGGRGGSQCARFANTSAHRNVATTSLTGVQWVELWASMGSTSGVGSIYAGTANCADTASAIRFGSSGQIEAYTTSQSGVGQWTALGAYSANTWYRIHIRLDYNINSYQVFVNGTLKASGCTFLSPAAYTGLRAIKLQEAGGAGLCVDDVYVGSVDPDFVRVSPDALTIVEGGHERFDAMSGASPIAWTIVEERTLSGTPAMPGSIAQIDATGNLTAIAPGSCRVRAQDISGRIDNSAAIAVTARQSASDIRLHPDGATAALSGLIVTGRFAGCVYAEAPDRSAGVRIDTTRDIPEGSVIGVVGTLTTIHGERSIEPSWIGD